MSQIAQNVTDVDTIKKNNESKATPTSSMVTTMMLILWYYIARFAFCDRYGVRKYGKKLSMVFSFLITIMILWSQFSINLAATGDKCSGDVQLYNAITYTLVPNLVFGFTVYVLLNRFPSWKSPFSNTIGYMFASMFGLRSTFNGMLKTSSNEGTDTINKIYKDPSMLINELQPDSPTVVRYDSNFDLEFKRLAKANIFKPGWEKSTKSMYNLVVLKDMVASMTWYFLTQMLIIATSFNGIMNINCIRSEKTLAKGKEQGRAIGKYGIKTGNNAKNSGSKGSKNLKGKASSSLSKMSSVF